MAKKKAAAAPPEKPKKHERNTKPSEADRLEKGKTLAAKYLERRDGMDPQLALDIVESMDADTINALIEEANTAIMGATADLLKTADAPKSVISFLAIPALANDEGFAKLVFDCAALSKTANGAKAGYKSGKEILYAKLMAAAGPGGYVECMGIKVEPYIGYSTFLDEHKLIEAGVDPALVKKGWKTTEYEDVRFIIPKEPKSE